MENVCKRCDDPCGVPIQRQGRQVTFAGLELVST